MSALHRSFRDLTRKKLRTVGVVIVIGLSLGVYLGLESVANAISGEVSYLEAAVQDVVAISENGSGGIFSQGNVNASILAPVSATPHVTSVQPLLIGRYDPTSGALGCLGRRGSASCVLIEGENTSAPLVIYGGGTPSPQVGGLLGPAQEHTHEAIMGQTLASRLGLSVGGTLDVNGTSFTVFGTFTTGTTFGDQSVIVPYPAALAASGQSGPTVLYVTVDSPGNVEVVVDELKGESWDATGGYDVTALINSEVPEIQQASNAVGSLTAFASSIALLLGTLIIVFVMVVATRERVREIGLMKAIGFRNGKIVAQSVGESLCLAGLGFVVGLLVMYLVGPELGDLLAGTGGRSAGGGGSGIGTLLASGLSFSPSLLVIAETLGIALLMGAAGAAYPIVRALRLKPAEALRYE